MIARLSAQSWKVPKDMPVGALDRKSDVNDRNARLVTVVIPAFNSENTIDRALMSALGQTHSSIEIIVVDDGSSDRTSEIVENYANRGVKLLRLPKQGGVSHARNAGISLAKGELIAFLDSDDEWLPTKITKQISRILSNDDCVFVSCACCEISSEGKILGDLYHGRRPDLGTDCWKSLLACNTVATPSVLVWRRHLIETGGFNEALRICEDQDMWIRLASLGSVDFVDEELVLVHSRPNSLSNNLDVSTLRVVFDVVDNHISMQRHRLTSKEVRQIRAARLQWWGRAQTNANYFHGVSTVIRAAAMGHQPFAAFLFLMSASPPARELKRLVRPHQNNKRRNGKLRITRKLHSNLSRHPMLPGDPTDIVKFLPNERPRLVIIVDAEEEFDWTAPLSRDRHTVSTMAAQVRAQTIYERFGVVPTYAIDYPIISQEAGYRPLLDLLHAGKCNIGAQLHTWVTPPFEEEVGERNSYAGNLDYFLQRRKLETLVEAIEKRFNLQPKLYRAGRYGTGSDTVRLLTEFGFEIDCSVVPGVSQWSTDAPDYSGGTAHPYWLSRSRPLLELPVTVANTGVASSILGDKFYRGMTSEIGQYLRLSAIMARSGLLNRVRLSPEGTSLEESIQLTRHLFARGYRFFSISYHSPSLEPGHTPYVRSQEDLRQFLTWLEKYLTFFFERLNGVPETPQGIFLWAKRVSNLNLS